MLDAYSEKRPVLLQDLTSLAPPGAGVVGAVAGEDDAGLGVKAEIPGWEESAASFGLAVPWRHLDKKAARSSFGHVAKRVIKKCKVLWDSIPALNYLRQGQR